MQNWTIYPHHLDFGIFLGCSCTFGIDPNFQPNPDQEESGLSMLMPAIKLASFRQERRKSWQLGAKGWCIPGRLTFHSMVHNSTDCSCCMAKVVAKIRCIEWGWANRRKGKHKQRKFWSQPSKLDGRAHNSCLYQRRREEKRIEEKKPRNIKKEFRKKMVPAQNCYDIYCWEVY